ncbi:phosphopantetheine-binding protein [Aquisphaera insulae]|uniref:phosphopantetheine-binding protein n=1 Tax=Aquisphaera insulae TaxID=2712864 RepID=UPI0013EB8D51|nr:phosphopantetheine-binding protein [Aquisphaera insulae]
MEPKNGDQPRSRPFRRVSFVEASYPGNPSSPVCLICSEKPGSFALDDDALCPTCGKLLSWFRSKFSEEKGLDLRSLTALTTFRDLSTDSLDHIEWVMEAEGQFGIILTDAVAERLLTVGDFLGYIRAHAGGTSPAGSNVMWDPQIDG